MAEIAFNKFPVLIVKRDSPAWEAIVRICKHPVTAGTCYPVSDEEFESLKEDTLAFELPDEHED